MRPGAWRTAPRRCASSRAREKSQRVEYRVAAADINPYIALAAAIGSGLWGIENRIEPGDPIQGNAYEVKHAPQERALPRTLVGGRRSG